MESLVASGPKTGTLTIGGQSVFFTVVADESVAVGAEVFLFSLASFAFLRRLSYLLFFFLLIGCAFPCTGATTMFKSSKEVILLLVHECFQFALHLITVFPETVKLSG